MVNTSIYRKQAREALHGQWSRYAQSSALVALLVTVCILPILSYIGFPEIREGQENTLNVWCSITMLILSPITWRYVSLPLHALRGEALETSMLFDGFRYTRKYMITYFTYTAILSFIAFFFSMSVLLTYSWFLRLQQETSNAFLCITLLGCVASLAALMWVYTLRYSYALVPYLLHNEEIEGFNALRTSHSLMKGHRWHLFILDLTFIGWYLLCIPTLGLGLLWVVPYHQAARAAFYEERRSKNQGSTAHTEQTSQTTN